MPRNPKAAAIEAATAVQRNYVNGAKHFAKLTENRKRAMIRCVEAGCTTVEVAKIFACTRGHVSNVVNNRQGKGV